MLLQHRDYFLNKGINYVGRTNFPTEWDNKPACYFTAAGVPGGGGTVILKNANKKKYVIVNPVAGRIRISDYPP